MSDDREALAVLLGRALCDQDQVYTFPDWDPDEGLTLIVDGHVDLLELADAAISHGWRQIRVYQSLAHRNSNTAVAIVNGERPVAIVGDRVSYWTGKEWKWTD